MRRTPRHQRPPEDRGVTLVELLVTIAVSGIVASALAAVIAVVLNNAASSPHRLDESRGLQQLAAYLPNDVASAIPNLISADPAEPMPCPGYTGGGANVLSLRWTEDSWLTGRRDFWVTYRTEQTEGRTQLFRVACDGPPPGNTSITAITSLSTPWDAAVDVTVNGGHVVMRLTLPDARVLSVAATSSSPTLGLDDGDEDLEEVDP